MRVECVERRMPPLMARSARRCACLYIVGSKQTMPRTGTPKRRKPASSPPAGHRQRTVPVKCAQVCAGVLVKKYCLMK